MQTSKLSAVLRKKKIVRENFHPGSPENLNNVTDERSDSSDPEKIFISSLSSICFTPVLFKTRHDRIQEKRKNLQLP